MIQRKAIEFLLQWKSSKNRKPLVLRGARQVGKTTLVEDFSRHYDVLKKIYAECQYNKSNS